MHVAVPLLRNNRSNLGITLSLYHSLRMCSNDGNGNGSLVLVFMDIMENHSRD